MKTISIMTIYLIRHAQSEFNAKFVIDRIDPIMYDSRLSELGKEQARQARTKIESLDISNVIVSPFTRTLQTASLLFGDDYPFKVNVMVREQLSNSCDVGSSPDQLAKAYPHLDFSHLDDIWWHQGENDHRGISVEPHKVLLERTTAFTEQLIAEKTKSTAIVTHGNYIHALIDRHPDNCEIIEFDPISKSDRSV